MIDLRRTSTAAVLERTSTSETSPPFHFQGQNQALRGLVQTYSRRHKGGAFAGRNTPRLIDTNLVKSYVLDIMYLTAEITKA